MNKTVYVSGALAEDARDRMIKKISVKMCYVYLNDICNVDNCPHFDAGSIIKVEGGYIIDREPNCSLS